MEHFKSSPGPGLGHMWGLAALAHGCDYSPIYRLNSDCRASELKCKSAWPVFFLELSKILETMAYSEGFSTLKVGPQPPDWSNCTNKYIPLIATNILDRDVLSKLAMA